MALNRRSVAMMSLAIAASLLLASISVLASPEFSRTGQPTSYVFGFSLADIRGFGEAAMGMSMEEVEVAVATMFPGRKIERSFEPVQQTHVLHLSVPKLPSVEEGPAPGPAALAFVFGASSERLMTINIEWFTAGDASSAERELFLEAGTAYVASLLEYFWEPFATSRGVVIGPNAVILFAGRDSQGRGVEVVVDGVPLDIERLDGSSEHRPVDTGPAYLRIRLSANPENPDVFTLPPGSF